MRGDAHGMPGTMGRTKRLALALLGMTLLAVPAGLLGGAAASEFIATGAGDASFDGGPPCPAMQALVEWHPRISNEPVMTLNFAAGQGAPALLCASGWRASFMPDEVRGDPEHGWTAHRSSPDAQTIDVVLTAADADGNRVLDVHQVTSLGDALDFHGVVVQMT